jgi:hypothetical protein
LVTFPQYPIKFLYREEDNIGYIVLERGAYSVDHYLSEMEGKIDFDTKKYILLDMISAWIFLF